MATQQKYRIFNLEDNGVTNTTDAIIAAGLDWEVAQGKLKGECFDRTNMEYVWRDLPQHSCVYRKDTSYPLGNSIVGKDFTLVQNSAAFSCFDEILQTQQARFVSGGWYHDGGSVFLQAKLPNGVQFDNGDSLERYLLMAQGHTGQQSLLWSFTHIRPSCSNTLQAALRDSTYKYTLKHTKSIKERINEGVKFMAKGLNHLEEVEKKMHIMSKLSLSEHEQINFLKMAYDRPIDEELKDWRNWKNIEPIFYAPKGSQYSKGTLWNPYNVVTEWEDHHSRVNKEKGQPTKPSDAYVQESRQVRSLFGANTVNRKVKAFRLADAVLQGDIDLKTGQPRDRQAKAQWAGLVAGMLTAATIQQVVNL